MFLINIVLGAAGLAAGLRLLPRDVGDRAVSIDALGSALLAACMLGLLFGLIQGSTDGWTAAPIAALAAGVIFFAAFAQRQRIPAVPLIKPSLLRNRGFTAGLILGLIFFATVAALLYAVSLFLQRGVGYSPERAAVTGFAPAAVGIVIASVACRNLLTRLGRRLSLAGLEQVLGLPLGQPRPAARRVDVAWRQLDAGPAVGQEHRASLAALQKQRQAGGAGLADDDVDGAALAAHLGLAVGQVEVLDVQAEHLGRARRGQVGCGHRSGQGRTGRLSPPNGADLRLGTVPGDARVAQPAAMVIAGGPLAIIDR